MIHKTGQFSFENFEIQGPLSSSILLTIYISILTDIDNKTFIVENNERIINSTYYYVIQVNFSKHCDPGQYYDNPTYWFFYHIY